MSSFHPFRKTFKLTHDPTAAVIGGGPAGLMAAEVLARAGVAVTVYDQMPSVGRKLLMAGRGGLNLTHAEPMPLFLSRYGAARAWLEPIIAAFPPEALIDWCNGLGQPTFIGSSARVFPTAMKASPLLRAWLRRLGRPGRADSVTAPLGRMGRRTETWRFEAPDGMVLERPAVTILALGGASWPRLGSDAGWTAHLPGLLAPFRPANCGFAVDWSPHFRDAFRRSAAEAPGHPLWPRHRPRRGGDHRRPASRAAPSTRLSAQAPRCDPGRGIRDNPWSICVPISA